MLLRYLLRRVIKFWYFYCVLYLECWLILYGYLWLLRSYGLYVVLFVFYGGVRVRYWYRGYLIFILYVYLWIRWCVILKALERSWSCRIVLKEIWGVGGGYLWKVRVWKKFVLYGLWGGYNLGLNYILRLGYVMRTIRIRLVRVLLRYFLLYLYVLLRRIR